MKSFLRVPLKMTGDRVLFIVVTWVFSITVSIFIKMIVGQNSNINIGVLYSILTSIPYVALIYYDAFDVGNRERNNGRASVKKAWLYCLVWQIPSIVLFILFLVFTSLGNTNGVNWTNMLMGNIWLAPFIGPRSVFGNTVKDIVQYLVFMAVEWVAFMISYVLGKKDIAFFKKKKQKVKSRNKLF